LAVVGVLGALVLDLAVLRTSLVRRRAFWTAYAIVLFFQLLTNGWLTGRDIVVYRADAILGWRLAYAPVEDLLFGFSMVLQTQAWWVWWGRRLRRADASTAVSRGAPVEP
jgi:lycopene cyclase domain-containing protein